MRNEINSGYRRRGEKLNKNTIQRLLLWLIIMAVLFIVYLTMSGRNMQISGLVENVISVSHNVIQLCTGDHVWPVKEWPSCEVKLSESVNYYKEPKDYLNFTQFSFKYVDQEEYHFGTNPLENKFAGHQSMQEREKSFHIKDQMLQKCAFVKGPLQDDPGFDFNEKDKTYMTTCKIVVSSGIFGGYDSLKHPVNKNISEYSKQNVCFIMFVDEPAVSSLANDGHIPDDDGYVGLWKLLVVRNLPYEDMRRNGKIPKILPHRLFPSAMYSIWVDAKLQLNADPMKVIEHYLWRTKSEYTISNHYIRHNLCEEVIRNKQLKKYSPTGLDAQIYAYYSDAQAKFDPHADQITFDESDGLAEFDISNPNLPSYVPEASFIVRAHTPMSNLFSCLWFNEVDRFSSRDQLAFSYTYIKLRRTNPDRPFYVHMYKDCERRALVKLFPHRENPPPLISS